MSRTGVSAATRSRRPLRVLQVVDGLQPGGAQTLVYAYARLGPAWNLSTFVAAIAPTHDATLASRLRAASDGLELIEHDATWDPRLLRALIATIRRERIDVVHTHLAGADIAGGAAGRLTRTPVVSSLHAVAEYRRQYTLRRRVLANTATRRFADALIAVSSATGESHVRELDLAPDALTVIRNAPAATLLVPDSMDVEAKRRELGIEGLVVTMVARLDPQKDHETLVRGAGALAATHPDAVVLIVGDGPRRSEIAHLVAAEGLQGRVRLLGSRADAVEIMAASDVACQLTLDLEGIPVALLDGLALGLPTIASAARGADEVVEDGVSGLLVPQLDVSAFSSALSRLLGHATLRAELGEGARRRVESTFGLERWMAETVAVYDRVLDGRAR